jgi:hypothetical protein
MLTQARVIREAIRTPRKADARSDKQDSITVPSLSSSGVLGASVTAASELASERVSHTLYPASSASVTATTVTSRAESVSSHRGTLMLPVVEGTIPRIIPTINPPPGTHLSDPAVSDVAPRGSLAECPEDEESGSLVRAVESLDVKASVLPLPDLQLVLPRQVAVGHTYEIKVCKGIC